MLTVNTTTANSKAARLSNENRPGRAIVHIEGPDGERYDSTNTRLWIGCNSVRGASYRYNKTGTISPKAGMEAFGEGSGEGLLIMDEAGKVLARFPAGQRYQYERVDNVVKISRLNNAPGSEQSLSNLSFSARN